LMPNLIPLWRSFCRFKFFVMAMIEQCFCHDNALFVCQVKLQKPAGVVA
jgi:hypothetical protein